jgi:hypothetical protein
VDGLRVVELLAWLTLGTCIYWSLSNWPPWQAGAATLAVLATSSGAVYFQDTGHCCDVVAQALLALNLVKRSRSLMAVTACLALFTDERAVLVLPLLALLTGWRPYAIGLAVYIVARLALAAWLYGPTDYSDVACLDYALAGLRLLPAVMWGQLEGGWILLGLSVAALWRYRPRLAVALALYPVAVACLSLAALDMTRSASYGMLAPVVALKFSGLRVSWPWWAGAALVSVLCPNSQFITGFLETFK